MSIKKDKYEISLWEDYIVSAQGEGENSIPEHYEERKIAIIGSNTMTAQWRAVEPKLVNNINGTNTLTFKMFYSFINNETGEKEDNPMLKLMVNERKIKCFWKNKWYDLVIKSCQEDSNGKSITYTCKDLFINELSKTGFDLEFDTELKNNQGTVNELATTILKGTDWQLGTSDIIKQNIEEPVYKVNVVSSFVTDNNINISTGDEILVFYSVFINRPTFFQFWYDDSQLFITDKSSMLVDNGTCESIKVVWSEVIYNGIPSWAISYNNTIIAYISKEPVVSEYRAKRLVRAQSQILDPLVDKYVYRYKKSDGKEVYGYPETKYDDVIAIVNYITNGEKFSSTDGWAGSGIIFQLYPLFKPEVEDNYEAKSYLKIPKSLVAYNSGIKDHRSYIDNGFIKGEKYIFRVKAMTETNNGPSGTYCDNNNIYLQPWIGQYTLNTDTNTYTRVDYFTVSTPVLNGNWVEFTLTCDKSATPNELLELGLFIDNSNSDAVNLWLESVEFFKYAVGDPVVQKYNPTKTFVEDDVVLDNSIYYICIKNNTGIVLTDTLYWKNLGPTKPKIRINPGSYSAQSYANIVWKFYEAGQSVLNIEDLNYLFSGDEISAKEYISNNLNPIYNDNYEKIRSITAKNSNRFNLLQSLAETFECWINFEIEHDKDTGRVIYKKGIPQKWVSFKNNIGIETGVGFVYGIDLKTISRTITSDAITSKVIVSPNNNEYGENGFCSISRATENYPKTNFILNFDYYISQGLLSQEQINNDLYSSVKGIGYYYWLNQYNTNYDAITKLIIEKKDELTKQKSLQKAYDVRINETNERITSVEDELVRLIGYTTFNITQIQNYLDKHPDNTTAKNLWIVRNNLKTSLKTYSAQLSNLNQSVESLDNYINGTKGLVEQQEEYVKKIEELDKKFYDKYSRFIQEGSWTSEDYYDDNLYYLDALSVAYTSSRPQITYNISVLRLSALEEFKNKVFNLGDISFIQDTEFFGYIYTTGDGQEKIKTPYKEKVLISEITSNFDSPENDSFKVQNYKTQFEDLFQRITATTQSLQYATGAYNKVASSFTATGEIEGETLEKSFQFNQNLAWAAKDDSVVYDTTGMTVVDTTDPTKIVRISSKGIQITEDGGEHWYLGITGSGISTKYLTSGFIATDKISIMDGAYPTFKWDKYGISAFYYELLDGVINNVKDGNFVRFDRFGLYGINTKLSSAWLPEKEDDIWETAKFGLTWKGFFVKNKGDGGWVEVSSENDVAIFKNNLEEPKIKIGRLGTDDEGKIIYGIKIADDEGNPVLITEDNGSLWLKERLNVETYNTQNSVQIGKLDKIGYKQVDLTENGGFEDGQIYYKLDENGKYVIVSSDEVYDNTVDYYIIINEGHGSRVINANNKFLVYEDGSIKATDGEFTGTIHATGGTIGGLNINTFDDLAGLASFSINARNISAAIDSTLIKFDENGITVNNGGLIIKKNIGSETEEILLQYDEEKESLYIRGNGEFTGTIKATDGEFNGTIKANSGTIGGFIINGNSIVSAGYKESEDSNYISGKVYYELINGEYIITTDTIFEEGKTYYEYTSNGSIELINDPITNSGIIKVNNIKLGEGAVISKYIKLGNSYIYNPNFKEGRFIEVTDGSGNSYISIKNDGVATFGSITIDGTKSEISGNNFTIAPERSNFSNVDITGTIHSSVFEIGKTQSVGGSMLFRESAEIQTITKNDDNSYTIITRTEIDLKEKSLVLLSGQENIYGEVSSANKDKTTFIIKSDNSESLIGSKVIIHLADYSSESGKYINNLLIGINSQNSTNTNLFGNAITFIDFEKIKAGTKYEPDYSEPKLLLGNLSSLGKSNINGYGLYGDNVYLKGSLTTQVGVGLYAGINTLSGAAAIKFAEDNSKIVFWAGSDGTGAENIQKSKFQVTENGSLYAQKGLFEGSIITNSIIQASDLYAIRLFGGTEAESAALNIYDTVKGIVFKTREIGGQVETETLRLNSNGFSIDEGKSYFVKIENNKIFFNGEQLNATSIMTKPIEKTLKGKIYYSLKLTGSEIIATSSTTDSSNTPLGTLKWEADSYSISLNDNNNITQNINQISLSTNLVQVNNNISFGRTMKYERYINNKNIECGYDLYISD